MLQKAEINPRWIRSVIAERGLPALGLEDILMGLALWDRSPSELSELVSRLHRGSDQIDDIEAMSQWIRKVKGARQGDQVKPHSVETPISPEQSLSTKSTEPRNTENRDADRESLLHPDRQLVQRTSHHVYGKSAALCAEPTTIRSEDPLDPIVHTVAIEVAPAVPGSRSKYFWERKVTLRFTRRELPLYAALLMGMTIELHCDKHGAQNDKSIILTDQGSHIFVKVRQGSTVLALPVPPEEVFALAAMAMAAISRNYPNVDGTILLKMLQRCVDMGKAAP